MGRNHQTQNEDPNPESQLFDLVQEVEMELIKSHSLGSQTIGGIILRPTIVHLRSGLVRVRVY